MDHGIHCVGTRMLPCNCTIIGLWWMLSWKRNRNWNRKKAEWNNSSNRLHRIFKTWRLLRHWNFGITQSRVATRHFPSTMSWIFHLTDIVAIHKMCFFFACVCLDSLVKRGFFSPKEKINSWKHVRASFSFSFFYLFFEFFHPFSFLSNDDSGCKWVCKWTAVSGRYRFSHRL